MWTRARAAAVGFAALTLAACGSIHPGDAAVVDGHSISMKTADKTAQAFCELTLLSVAEQQGTPGAEPPSVPNSEMRRQAITQLVTVRIARDLAEAEGVMPKAQEYKLEDSRRASIADAYKDDDHADTIAKTIEDNQEVITIAIALGAKSSGVTRTDENAGQLLQVGQEEILKAIGDHDVDVAPRFGLDSSLEQVAETGSLSVAEIDFDRPTEDELPAAQRCD